MIEVFSMGNYRRLDRDIILDLRQGRLSFEVRSLLVLSCRELQLPRFGLVYKFTLYHSTFASVEQLNPRG